MIQATKNNEESCSFLDAIGRRSCGPLSGLARNRHVGKPKLRIKRIETAGRYATVRFVTLPISSDLHFNSPSSLACFSSACTSFGHATESEVHASHKNKTVTACGSVWPLCLWVHVNCTLTMSTCLSLIEPLLQQTTNNFFFFFFFFASIYFTRMAR